MITRPSTAVPDRRDAGALWPAIWPAIAALAFATGCDRPEKTGPPAPPARVERSSKEAELATVILQPDAARRLGIADHLVAVERRAMPSTRVLPGQVLLVPGGSSLIVAPFAGTIALVEPSELPMPGSAVARGQALLLLLPVLTPVDRINLAASLAEAEGQVARAKVEVDSAEIALRRIEPLVTDRALAGRALEDVQAVLGVARAGLEAATARRDSIRGSTSAAGSAPITLTSPIEGVVRDLRVAPGEVVAAGAPLAEVVTLLRLQVRVAVPRAELEQLDRTKPARVTPLAASEPARFVEARLVAAPPPTVGLLPGSIDLLFELDNEAGLLLPGERVAVALTRSTDEQSLVVAWSAVVQDALGGQWVYVASEPCKFTRTRVHVMRVEGELAVLHPSSAVDVNAMVVTAGAAELFGIEFGVGQ